MVSSWWFEGRLVTIFAGHVWLHGFSNMLPWFQISHFFCQHTWVWNHLKTIIFDIIFEMLLIPFLTLTPKSLPLSPKNVCCLEVQPDTACVVSAMLPSRVPAGTCWVDDFPNHTVNGAEMHPFPGGYPGTPCEIRQFFTLLPVPSVVTTTATVASTHWSLVGDFFAEVVTW